MQGYDAYRQALIDPDNLAALNIPFRDTEWMGCGNVAWYAYAGQQLHTYFEKEGIAAKLFRKYPALLNIFSGQLIVLDNQFFRDINDNVAVIHDGYECFFT
jgi:hypothetical protein